MAWTGPKSPWVGVRACRYRPWSALIRAVARQPAITSCAVRSMASSAASDSAAMSSSAKPSRSAAVSRFCAPVARDEYVRHDFPAARRSPSTVNACWSFARLRRTHVLRYRAAAKTEPMAHRASALSARPRSVRGMTVRPELSRQIAVGEPTVSLRFRAPAIPCHFLVTAR
jgi:hypothetical protein